MAHQLAKDHSTSRWSKLNNRNTRIETLFLMLPVSLNMVQCARRSSTAYWFERSRGQCEVEGWNMQSADCTMDVLKQRLSSLFQDAVVLYTDKVITMSFKAASLAQDMQNFRLYVQYSSFASSADKNAYVYNLVREKMHSAVPNCLVTAQTKYQLHLPVASSSSVVFSCFQLFSVSCFQ